MAAVCVFCSSSSHIAPQNVALAAEVGRLIGERGHRLVSGGGRVSMMGAVARAARAAGAHTLGVIPEALMGWEVADTDADELVVTGDMRERKARMDAAADAFLALPGGLGTLEELLEIWVAATLGMHDKPVVVLDPAGTLRGLSVLVEDLVAAGFVRRAAADVVRWAGSAQEALEMIESGLRAGAGSCREQMHDGQAPVCGEQVPDALEAEL